MGTTPFIWNSETLTIWAFVEVIDEGTHDLISFTNPIPSYAPLFNTLGILMSLYASVSRRCPNQQKITFILASLTKASDEEVTEGFLENGKIVGGLYLGSNVHTLTIGFLSVREIASHFSPQSAGV